MPHLISLNKMPEQNDFAGTLVRPAQMDDLHVLAHLLAETNRKPPLKAIEALIRPQPNTVMLVIVPDDKTIPMGFVYVHATTDPMDTDTRVARLVALAVSPTARRQGLGMGLVSAALEWARAQNCQFIELDTPLQATAAQGFWDACGFRITSFAFRKRV